MRSRRAGGRRARCGKLGPPPRSTRGTAARSEQWRPQRPCDARAVSSSLSSFRGWGGVGEIPLSAALQNWDSPHALTRGVGTQRIEAIRDSQLSMDALVREKIQTSFGFRFVMVDDYATAMQVENAIKSGRLKAGRPRLNPSQQRP